MDFGFNLCWIIYDGKWSALDLNEPVSNVQVTFSFQWKNQKQTNLMSCQIFKRNAFLHLESEGISEKELQDVRVLKEKEKVTASRLNKMLIHQLSNSISQFSKFISLSQFCYFCLIYIKDHIDGV